LESAVTDLNQIEALRVAIEWQPGYAALPASGREKLYLEAFSKPWRVGEEIVSDLLRARIANIRREDRLNRCGVQTHRACEGVLQCNLGQGSVVVTYGDAVTATVIRAVYPGSAARGTGQVE